MAFVQSVILPETASTKDATLENKNVLYGRRTLPVGIRSKRVVTNTGATLHVLEAGYESRTAPCVVLLHGFPELGYSWRNQLLPVAQAGFHVIAPDLRGYGQSVTQPVQYSDDLLPYSMLNRVSDVVGLVCSQLWGVHLIAQAGHSLAEERPQEVNAALLDFLITARTASA